LQDICQAGLVAIEAPWRRSVGPEAGPTKRWQLLAPLAVALALTITSVVVLGLALSSQGLGSAVQLDIGQPTTVPLNGGNYVVYQNVEDAGFPLSPSGLLATGSAGPLPVFRYTSTWMNLIPSPAKTVYEGVETFSAPESGSYSIKVNSGSTPLLLARSPRSIATGQFGWLVSLMVGTLTSVTLVILLIVDWTRRKQRDRFRASL
jgi:hypothetical protein